MKVTKFNNELALKKNCQMIKGKYYEKNKDCFFVDGRWRRVESGLIALDHEDNEYKLISKHNLQLGIVNVNEDLTEVEFGYFTPNIIKNQLMILNPQLIYSRSNTSNEGLGWIDFEALSNSNNTRGTNPATRQRDIDISENLNKIIEYAQSVRPELGNSFKSKICTAIENNSSDYININYWEKLTNDFNIANRYISSLKLNIDDPNSYILNHSVMLKVLFKKYHENSLDKINTDMYSEMNRIPVYSTICSIIKSCLSDEIFSPTLSRFILKINDFVRFLLPSNTSNSYSEMVGSVVYGFCYFYFLNNINRPPSKSYFKSIFHDFSYFLRKYLSKINAELISSNRLNDLDSIIGRARLVVDTIDFHAFYEGIYLSFRNVQPQDLISINYIIGNDITRYIDMIAISNNSEISKNRSIRRNLRKNLNFNYLRLIYSILNNKTHSRRWLDSMFGPYALSTEEPFEIPLYIQGMYRDSNYSLQTAEAMFLLHLKDYNLEATNRPTNPEEFSNSLFAEKILLNIETVRKFRVWIEEVDDPNNFDQNMFDLMEFIWSIPGLESYSKFNSKLVIYNSSSNIRHFLLKHSSLCMYINSILRLLSNNILIQDNEIKDNVLVGVIVNYYNANNQVIRTRRNEEARSGLLDDREPAQELDNNANVNTTSETLQNVREFMGFADPVINEEDAVEHEPDEESVEEEQTNIHDEIVEYFDTNFPKNDYKISLEEFKSLYTLDSAFPSECKFIVVIDESIASMLGYKDLQTGVYIPNNYQTAINNKKYNNYSLSYNVGENSTIEKYVKKINNILNVNFQQNYFDTMLNNNSFGIEYETSEGLISPPDLAKNSIVPLRDGSLDGGIEYTTLPLKGYSGVLKTLNTCNALSKTTEINQKCSLHIHIGGIKATREYGLALYMLYKQIQQEILEMLPNYKTSAEYLRNSSKDYSKALRGLGLFDINFFDSNGNLNQSNFKKGFNNLFSFLTEGHEEGERYNITNKNHPKSGSNKWNWKSRYYALNLLNLFFKKSETVEFRIHTPTTNANKVIPWLFICNAICRYAESNFRKILDQDEKITLLDVVDEYKTNFGKGFNSEEEELEICKIAEQLKSYILERKGIFDKMSYTVDPYRTLELELSQDKSIFFEGSKYIINQIEKCQIIEPEATIMNDR